MPYEKHTNFSKQDGFEKNLPKVLSIRPAVRADLQTIVALLADDQLGVQRDDPSLPLDPGYLAAFIAISANPNDMLIVAERSGDIIGTMQLTFMPGLARRGAWRGMIKAVRIRADSRGQGLGEEMMIWAVEECHKRGCQTVQLVSNTNRAAAHRFYERMGLRKSHYGYEMSLECMSKDNL